VRIIQKVMHREAHQRRWGRIRITMRPQKGVRWHLKLDTGGEVLYATREVVQHKIAERYKKFHTAPIIQDAR
jgi:hypothetical protein